MTWHLHTTNGFFWWKYSVVNKGWKCSLAGCFFLESGWCSLSQEPEISMIPQKFVIMEFICQRRKWRIPCR